MKIQHSNGKPLKIRFQFSCSLDRQGKLKLESCILERRGAGNRERSQLPRIVSASVQGLHKLAHHPKEFRGAGIEQFFPDPVQITRHGNRISLKYPHPASSSILQSPEQFSEGAEPIYNAKPVAAGAAAYQFMDLLHGPDAIRKKRESGDIKNWRVAILDKTPNFIAMTDGSGELLYLNPAGRVLMGIGREADVSGISIIDCHALQSRLNLTRNAMPSAKKNGMWSGDSVLLNANGQEIPTNLLMIAHFDIKDILQGYSVVEQDISVWVHSEHALRHSQEELQRLSDQLITVQETERQRIASDLHDSLGQYLSLIKMSLEYAVRQMNDGAPAEAAASLERLIPKVKDTLTEVRRISMDLRPSTLDDLGILATLSWFFREFEEHCQNIRVEKDFIVTESDIPEPVKISIFRILQEAVNNIVKHADASLIRVSLKRDMDFLRLVIEDNGKGFDLNEQRIFQPTPEDGGLGLLGMKERAHLSGGILSIRSSPREGTRITIQWPLQRI